jgi:hypothetical protein
LTTITAADNENALKAHDIIYTSLLPEFPNTHEDGFAYIINVVGWTKQQIEAVGDNVSNKYISNIFRMYY